VSAALSHAPRLIEATAPPEYRGIARDKVRLLVTDRATRTHTHAAFFEVAAYLRAGDLIVVNDSATVPAALPARRSGGEAIQLHISTKIDERIWLAEPRGTVLAGEELQLPGGASAVTLAPVEPQRPRLWYTWFQLPDPMYAYLAYAGEPIRYGYVTKRFPLRDYQTMFAREPGSCEMPSAARPFTPRVVDALRERSVELATITLHCGVASFESPERPGTERFIVPHTTAERIDATRRRGGRVIAVGTTVLRALESPIDGDRVVAASCWTDLVIDEHRAIRSADGILSGFHDGNATHMWIMCAFLDRALLSSAYDEAAFEAYRYHEFGDVHLIL
jgi:S-adenosylmethionine:tRNA ribosyltransferase-isomerase